MSSNPEPSAVLTIAVGLLTPELLAQLGALGATVTPDLDEPLVIDLPKPIEGPAGPVSQIVISEPTAAQIAQWDKLSGSEADIVAISVAAGVPRTIVEKLPARQFYKAARRIGAFLD